MLKAYDRMKWDFLEETLKAMDFRTMFIDFIMECISSIPYLLLLIGSLYGRIQLTRGLR